MMDGVLFFVFFLLSDILNKEQLVLADCLLFKVEPYYLSIIESVNYCPYPALFTFIIYFAES